MKRRDILAVLAGPSLASIATAADLPRDNGYRGIWYFNQPSNDAYRYTYSGGFVTYPQQHLPSARHVPAARKTFFCYGGTEPGKNQLLHMVSYFDHSTGEVPPPRHPPEQGHQRHPRQSDSLGG